MLVLKNGNIFVNGKFYKGDILLHEGRVLKIGFGLSAEKEQDFSGHYILPSFLDPHVHLREPGFHDKETIAQTSKACIKGGYGTIFTTPDTNPVIDSLKNVKQQRWVIDKYARLNVHQFSSITRNFDQKELVNFDELHGNVLGFSDGGRAIQDSKLLSNAMSNFTDHNVLFALTSDKYSEGESNPRRAEFKHVKRNIDLAKKHRIRLHLYSVGAYESFKYIRQQKKLALKFELKKSVSLERDKAIKSARHSISCEVPIHNLLLNKKDNQINFFRFYPEIKSESERKKLVEAFRMGLIDIITTDYTPQTDSDYNVLKNSYPVGAAYIEHALPLLYSKLHLKDQVPFELIVHALSEQAYTTFGLNGGKIEEGQLANFSIWDFKEPYEITRENTIATAKNNPFLGEVVYGVNRLTYINGEIKLSSYDAEKVNKRLNKELLGLDLEGRNKVEIEYEKLYLNKDNFFRKPDSELKKAQLPPANAKPKKEKKVKEAKPKKEKKVKKEVFLNDTEEPVNPNPTLSAPTKPKKQKKSKKDQE